MKRAQSTLLIALLVLCVPAAVAQTASLQSNPNATPGEFVVRDVIHPLAPQQITQNVDPNTLVDGTSLACASGGVTTDNHWWRLFDLDDDHGLLGNLAVASVDYGIETASGPQTITAKTYCLNEGLPFQLAFLNETGSTTQNQPDAELEFFNIPVGGLCNTAGQDLALEMKSEDCLESGTCLQLFIGCNDLGETAPSYIHADDCEIFEPWDLSFYATHIVYVVNGEAEGGTDDDGAVPATTGTGAVLMLLALLGVSAYVVRWSGGAA